MSSLFTLEKFDVSQDFPEMKIFQSDYKPVEKNDLVERVSTFKKEVTLNISTLLQGICHPDFKVTIYDADLLQDLKKVSTFFAKHANFRPAEANQEVVWQTIALNLDRVIREKAAFPLLNLDEDILFRILSYLSLHDMSNLMRVTNVKKNSLNSANPVPSSTETLKNLKKKNPEEGWTNLGTSLKNYGTTAWPFCFS